MNVTKSDKMIAMKCVFEILFMSSLFSINESINLIKNFGDIKIWFNDELSATLSKINLNNAVNCYENNFNYCYQLTEDQSLLIDESIEKFNSNDVKCTTTTWINAPDFKQMCFDLGKDQWFGGGNDNFWNIKKSSSRPRSPYYTGDPLGDKFGESLIEPLWISSSGVGIFIDRNTPLFMSYNNMNNGTLCFSASYDEFPYNSTDIKPDKKVLKITVCEAMDAKEMTLYAINTWLGKPSAVPDLLMMTKPIWSTSALPQNIYGQMNQTKVIQLAQQIIDNKFSKSQIEIDVGWEQCYGEWDFDINKYPDPIKMVNDLEKLGFKLTLWLNGFVSKKCPDTFNEGIKNGYFIKLGKTEEPLIHDDLAFIDFTNPSSQEWFAKKIEFLKSKYGIFSFKFDGKISSFLSQDFHLFNQTLQKMNPSFLSKAYAETIFKASGNSIELSVGFNTQNLPVFVQMENKASSWTDHNGIKSVIPNAFLFSLYGYPFILADVIGGNNKKSLELSEDYNNQILPDKELFIRWTQMNALLSSMQFSIPPWAYNDTQVLTLTSQMTKLHQSFGPTFQDLSEQSEQFGFPIIRPIWWEDPKDDISFLIDDQFMLGDEVMVAPLLQPNARQRNIYLTKGNWIDENLGQFNVGPIWLYNYSVPLDILPYFRKGQCNPCDSD